MLSESVSEPGCNLVKIPLPPTKGHQGDLSGRPASLGAPELGEKGAELLAVGENHGGACRLEGGHSGKGLVKLQRVRGEGSSPYLAGIQLRLPSLGRITCRVSPLA